MKFPALLIITGIILSGPVFTGISYPSGSDSLHNTRSCCTDMNPCSLEQNQNTKPGQCPCHIPERGIPCSCGYQGRMMSPSSSIADRFRQYCIRGYRRISRKNILEHDSRKLLYSVICTFPGQDLKGLTERTGLNEHTLKYHLDKIILSGQVTVHNKGNGKHYFENHGTFSAQEQHFLSRIHENGPKRILQTVYQTPGLSRGEIAAVLGVSGPVISRTMQHLVEERLVNQVTDGKFRRYYPGFSPGIDIFRSRTVNSLHSGQPTLRDAQQ